MTPSVDSNIKALSVSDINSLSRQALENVVGNAWIIGEVSNLSKPSSGHLYFSLKDRQSQVRCALFKQSNNLKANELQNGQQILVFASVSLYEPRGDYQLLVRKVKIAGSGLLQLKFEQLKKKLHKEGLFDSSKKRPIPAFPNQLGVITSQTGAAIQDILKVLKRRFPLCPVRLYPCLVQGPTAAPSICSRLKQANQENTCDVLLLSRGGGSLEDLWPFNEESVARSIAASQIPIISGVGHEIDITIADLVADQRAATPSTAAELASPDQQKWSQHLSNLHERMHKQLTMKIKHYQQTLLHCKKRLRHPNDKIKQLKQTVDHLEYQLSTLINQQLHTRQQQLKQYAQNLNHLNPLNTLERGYCISSSDTGHIITEASELKNDQQITLQYHNSTAQLTVTHLLAQSKINKDMTH